MVRGSYDPIVGQSRWGLQLRRSLLPHDGPKHLTGVNQSLPLQGKTPAGHNLWLLTLQHDVARITALLFFGFLVHSGFDMAACARLVMGICVGAIGCRGSSIRVFGRKPIGSAIFRQVDGS